MEQKDKLGTITITTTNTGLPIQRASVKYLGVIFRTEIWAPKKLLQPSGYEKKSENSCRML